MTLWYISQTKKKIIGKNDSSIKFVKNTTLCKLSGFNLSNKYKFFQLL